LIYGKQFSSIIFAGNVARIQKNPVMKAYNFMMRPGF